jgi:hypothetical protein
MNPVSRICPITDPEAERLVRPATFADLSAQITATPPPEAGPRLEVSLPPEVGPAPGTRQLAPAGRGRRRPRRPIRAPLAAALALALLATAALVATRLLSPGHQAATSSPTTSTHPTASSPPAQVLSFTTSAGYITVIVRDPLADPSRYRAAFAAHHLDITLSLVPVSPSLVGTVVYTGQPAGSPEITIITAQGKCYTGGGGSACPVGVRIPVGFGGQAQLVFGRAARPGERYESTASPTAPGEVMHGLTFVGDTVAQVLALLRQRDVTVPDFNYDDHGYNRNVASVPGTWYVYDANPWALQQVMLMVGPTRTPPVQAPQPGSPVPSPTASASR